MHRLRSLFILTALLGGGAWPVAGDDLAGNFANPPPTARPWVYWFPLSGNISSNGITADLEAMQRVGIGGVLYMETAQGTPPGPAQFGGPLWRDLFKYICSESHRLGMEVNMNNDAGWCGSGGPWITPELSMQQVVWTATNVSGPLHFCAIVSQPLTRSNFYRDIALLAFPTPASDYVIPGIQYKSALKSGETPPCAVFAALPPEATIPRGSIVDLTSRLKGDGSLAWDVPAGHWTLLRLGHTTTGVENHPAPPGGLGLESDKLSKKASEVAFAGLMAKVIRDSSALTGKGKTLVSTHIDSWETGSQNWTPDFRAQFRRLRGYDLLSFLPVMTGRVVDNLEVSERFLWDVRKTVDDLLLENYAGQFHKLAHRHGLRLSIEAYWGEPAEDMAYGGRADEPMGEFWSWTRYAEAGSCTEMASAAHIYGKPILGAESFTATDKEKWQGFPGSLKELGDWAFCEGINRFVFHRYALQPWTHPDRPPGVSMGPWGLHYERTQTWWELSKPWHQYLARCQFLLRQGLYQADLCFLEPESSPLAFHSPVKSGLDRPGYAFDGCTPEVVLTRMSVKDGRIVLPDGMSYRMLVLPKAGTMTPRLLDKIRELVAAGATVVGAPPFKSPSLTDYPKCDDQVRRLAGQLWGAGEPPKELTARPFGKGKIVWGGEFSPIAEPAPSAASQPASTKADSIPNITSLSRLLAAMGVPPDFSFQAADSSPCLRFIHRATNGTDLYFVANKEPHPEDAVCSFRVQGRRPELWRPDTGRIERVAAYDQQDGCVRMPMHFDPSGSVFVVFRDGNPVEGDRITAVSRDGAPLLAVAPILRRDQSGRLDAEVSQPGKYELTSANGHSRRFELAAVPQPLQIVGPWDLSFPPNWGAPEHVILDRLISWSEHPDDGVKYFSGAATYSKTIHVPASLIDANRRLYLDLGQVAVMAQVKLNGQDLGILWKAPYRLEVTPVIRPGENDLQLRVVNLWINRLIGDEQLPEDSDRKTNGTLKQWPEWLTKGQPSPTGRFTFTSWRLYKKDDALVQSGLIGPVTITAAEKVVLAGN